jgi:hypothetical protein
MGISKWVDLFIYGRLQHFEDHDPVTSDHGFISICQYYHVSKFNEKKQYYGGSIAINMRKFPSDLGCMCKLCTIFFSETIMGMNIILLLQKQKYYSLRSTISNED